MLFMFGVFKIVTTSRTTNSYESDCLNECNKFNLSFYKTEMGCNKVECWCLKDNIPYNIGGMK